MARQIGFYNATHRHGEPLENMIQRLKARRGGAAGANRGVAGAGPTGAGPAGAVHDPSLDPQRGGYNRTNAPVGPMPAWVARQMAQGKGLMHPGAVPPQGGVPAGVVPTKPVEAVQGSDSLTGLAAAVGFPPKPGPYPTRRPQAPRRRLPAWMTRG